MFVLISVFVLVFCFFFKQWRNLQIMDRSVGELPTLPSKPIIGHFHLISSKNARQNLFDLIDNIDETFKLWFGPWLAIFVQEKDDVKIAFQSISKPLFYKFGPKSISNSLGIMTDGMVYGRWWDGDELEKII